MQATTASPALSYREILQELSGLMTGRWLTDLANTSALLFQHVPNINWVGFYLTEIMDPVTAKENVLWLGPFQGLPACTLIPFSKGVCGSAATNKKSVRVENVDSFPGHIVCDSRSKSEVAVPVVVRDRVIGILDVDSATVGRFTMKDQDFFEAVVQILLEKNKL